VPVLADSYVDQPNLDDNISLLLLPKLNTNISAIVQYTVQINRPKCDVTNGYKK